MDIFDQLEQKLMDIVARMEGLQQEQKQWHAERQQLQQQLQAAGAAKAENDSQRLLLEQEIQQLKADNGSLRKDNTRLSHDNNEWAAKAESLLQLLELAEA